MKKAIFAILLAAALYQPATAAKYDNSFIVLGPGTFTCQKAIKDYRNGLGTIYGLWLSGFITAINEMSEDTHSVLPKDDDISSVEAMVLKQCSSMPTKSYIKAAQIILGRLSHTAAEQEMK